MTKKLVHFAVGSISGAIFAFLSASFCFLDSGSDCIKLAAICAIVFGLIAAISWDKFQKFVNLITNNLWW